MTDKNVTMMNEKICMLYKQGLSCKDISLKCNMSVSSIRANLRSSGFDTRSYRKTSEYNKNKVILLIESGYSYMRIERLLHVSTHLIREIVSRAGLVGNVSKNHPPIQLQVREDQVSSDTIKKLRDVYFAGTYGLAKCAEELNVSDEEFLWFIYHLSEDEVSAHHDRLTCNFKEQIAAGLSVATIAKQCGVSPAIVKRTI